MDTDVLFVVGTILAAVTLPALLTAYTEGRVPRIPIAMLLAGGVMVAYALHEKPSGYSFAQIPTVFGRVFSKMGA